MAQSTHGSGKHGRSGSRVCAATGLTIEPSANGMAWRIAKTSYGPMNPEVRPASTPRLGWGRYDVVEHRTIYGAAPTAAAYGESLAALRVKFDDRTALSELFDDSDTDTVIGRTLLEEITTEWAERNHMAPGMVAAGWRRERLLYTITLPATGWFVDIESADSIAAVSHALRAELGGLGLSSLTVSNLRGENREITTRIAEWVRDQVLDDGSVPHGIRFRSKHGSDWNCWAIWLRAVDDGKPRRSEPTKADKGQVITDPEHNSPLAEVGRLFELTIH
jgi:hypothetical protein